MRILNQRGVPVTTNTPNCSGENLIGHKSYGWRWKKDKIEAALEQMIEPDLIGNNESASVVTQNA